VQVEALVTEVPVARIQVAKRTGGGHHQRRVSSPHHSMARLSAPMLPTTGSAAPMGALDTLPSRGHGLADFDPLERERLRQTAEARWRPGAAELMKP
jgi:hypothetical protein